MEMRLDQLLNMAFQVKAALVQGFEAAGFRITAEEWATLKLLQGDPGVTPSKLAIKVGRDQTTVTRMIDRLVMLAGFDAVLSEIGEKLN